MNINIDFSLNRRFGVVDNLVFRLVLNGMSDAETICNMLWPFSDQVCANSIMKLVNCQLLVADVERRQLRVSPAVTALAEACRISSFDVVLPEVLLAQMQDGVLLIDNLRIKEAVFQELVPQVRLDFLAKMLEFWIREGGS